MLHVVGVYPENLETNRTPDSSKPCHEGTKSEDAGDRWCSGGTGCSMLGVKLALTFHLHVVARDPTILDAIAGIDVDVDVFANIIWQGLIHLLVGVAIDTLTARWTRWESDLIGISFVVAPGTLIKVGAVGLVSRVLGALMLTSSVE